MVLISDHYDVTEGVIKTMICIYVVQSAASGTCEEHSSCPGFYMKVIQVIRLVTGLHHIYYLE